MMVRYKVFVLGLLLILGLLVACKPGSQVSPLNSPLQPTPTPTEKISYALPRPAQGKAVIGGVMMVENTETPMMSVELYLANHIGSTPDTPIYTLDPSSAPRAMTDNEGRFVFKDVPPGRYAIVVWNPFNSFLARNPQTGLEVIIDAQPDQVYDVGTLYEPLP